VDTTQRVAENHGLATELRRRAPAHCLVAPTAALVASQGVAQARR
jgi:hypothetical protein